MDNKMLLENFRSLVQVCQPHLRANFEPYSVYHKNNATYCLVYVDYQEKEGISDSEVEKISQEDSIYLHKQMKDKDLPLDYLFVVPYYDYLDRKNSSFVCKAVITKDFF